MTTTLLFIRTLLFYCGYFPLIIWFGLTGILFFSFLPYKIRSAYILLWNRCTVFWLKLSCGVRFKVEGQENIPDQPFVALCKHSSEWETFFLQYLLAPVTIVLKRELLSLPFFGWGLRLTRPIAIDRGNPKQALKQTLEQGEACIKDGISVLVFPEGTRKPQPGSPKYARGGANIAVKAKAPVIYIAHNAAEYWPTGKFLKYPGTIQVKFSEPVDSTQLDSRTITEMAKTWIEAQVEAMPKR